VFFDSHALDTICKKYFKYIYSTTKNFIEGAQKMTNNVNAAQSNNSNTIPEEHWEQFEGDLATLQQNTTDVELSIYEVLAEQQNTLAK
jgi:hypothetical protein